MWLKVKMTFGRSEVVHWDLVASSLSKRIACVELGSNRSSDGLILVKASKWPFLLREG